MDIAVITKAPCVEGNLGTIFAVEAESRVCQKWVEIDQFSEDVKSENVAFVETRVFSVGEILVLDEYGRDQMTRKPSKWCVEYEVFDNIEAAVERARQAVEEE